MPIITKTRDELITLAHKAADKSGLLPSNREKIIAALSDPSVTHVARGSFDAPKPDRSENCYCPVSLVDRELPDRADLSAEEANLMAFYPSWDDATFVSGQRQHSKVIEVIG